MDEVRLPPPVVPLAAVAVAGAVHRWLDVPELPSAAWTAGAFLTALGVALVLWAITEQTRAGTNPDVRAETSALVVVGPYNFSRNPIYLGFLLAQGGIGLWSGWWVAAALVPLSGVVLTRYVIHREEAQLANRFPDYESYRDRVRRWF